ncbi:MAG: type IX secretion system membrane protein PorP/SprF, partial [Crocinitomicaceae bacterium]
ATQESSEAVEKFAAFGKLTLNSAYELSDSQNRTFIEGVAVSETESQLLIAAANANSPVNGDASSRGLTNDPTNTVASHSIGSDNFELSSNVTAQIHNASQNVTNSHNSSYESELNDRLAHTDEVGEKNFYVREPSELDIYEGRVWNERKSPWTGRTYSSSSASSRRSLKDRLNKFTRSIERMMNSPIALQNSRDPHYHVPGMTANDISFSSSGTLISTRVQTQSRLQWQGKENEQLMNQISADGYSYGMRGGWGVQLNHQMYGNGGIQAAQAAFTYSPKISVSKWFSIEPSVRMKMGNKRLNPEQMQGTELVEMERGNTREFYANGDTPIGRSLWYRDLGVGLLVNTKWFFAGIQGDNLFRHKDNLYSTNWSDPRRVENHLTATIGSDWVSRNEKMSLSPYLVYQKNEDLSEVWGGANFAYKWFSIGAAVSSNLEPAASIGMRFDHFSLHYNADYTQSSMLEEKALSHQLTVRITAKKSAANRRLFKR